MIETTTRRATDDTTGSDNTTGSVTLSTRANGATGGGRRLTDSTPDVRELARAIARVYRPPRRGVRVPLVSHPTRTTPPGVEAAQRRRLARALRRMP